MLRHLKESLISLKRNGWMTFGAALAVSISLILVSIFALLILNLGKITQEVEKSVNVSVFVSIGTEQKDLKTLKEELEGLNDVQKVAFSSKDEQLEKVQKEMGDAFDPIKGDENPLYDVYIVQAKSPEDTKQIQQAAQKLAHVEYAEYGGKAADRLIKGSKNARLWALIAGAVLILVAILLIANTIRLTIFSRSEEIQIMRLVGAKNSYIRAPFFLEGAWIGILGAILPVALIVFGYPVFYQKFNPEVLKLGYALVQPHELALPLSLGILTIGIVIGSLGSVFSMRRFLKA